VRPAFREGRGRRQMFAAARAGVALSAAPATWLHVQPGYAL